MLMPTMRSFALKAKKPSQTISEGFLPLRVKGTRIKASWRQKL